MRKLRLCVHLYFSCISSSSYFNGLWDGRQPYRCCFVKCCFEDFFKISCSIRVLFPSIFFFWRFVKVKMAQLYYSTHTPTAWKKARLILSEIILVDNMSIAVLAFPMEKLTSLSVDKILLPRYVKWSKHFRGLSFNVEMVPSFLKNTWTQFYLSSCMVSVSFSLFQAMQQGFCLSRSIFEKRSIICVVCIRNSLTEEIYVKQKKSCLFKTKGIRMKTME